MNPGAYVVMRELSRDQACATSPNAEASFSLVLRSLQDPERLVLVDSFASEEAARATGAAVHRVLLAVEGPWGQPPSHAVCAVWEVKDLEHAAAFVESRRQLFTLRQRVLPTFAADWLLQPCDQEGRYAVLGFYGDEEGATRLCREHPEIRQFTSAHPASHYTAQDRTGLLCWRIERFSPVGRTQADSGVSAPPSLPGAPGAPGAM